MVKVFDLGATGHGFNPRLGPSFKVLQNIGKQFFCKSHLNSVHAYWLDAGATGPLPSCFYNKKAAYGTNMGPNFTPPGLLLPPDLESQRKRFRQYFLQKIIV